MCLPMTTQLDLYTLRLDLSVNAKNGINFVLAAALVWLAITLVWILPCSLKTKPFGPLSLVHGS